MLNELLLNWQITTQKHPYTLKAETQAEGETLQRLGGCGGEKIKTAFIFAF